MQETQGHSLGWEGSPPPHRRREWQPTPVLLPRRIPWTEEPGGIQSMGVQSMDWQRVRHDWATNTLCPANHPTLAKASRLIGPLQRREGLKMRCSGWIPPWNGLAGSERWKIKLNSKSQWQGFPGGSVVTNPPANAGGHGFDLWSRKIPHAVEEKARVP